jgi:hypothetical protein
VHFSNVQSRNGLETYILILIPHDGSDSLVFCRSRRSTEMSDACNNEQECAVLMPLLISRSPVVAVHLRVSESPDVGPELPQELGSARGIRRRGALCRLFESLGQCWQYKSTRIVTADSLMS